MPNEILHAAAIARAAVLNGPLPVHPPATPEGAAFWQGHGLAPDAPSGTDPVPSRLFAAFRAGRRRKLLEPGIDPGTDPRCHVAPLGRMKF